MANNVHFFIFQLLLEPLLFSQSMLYYKRNSYGRFEKIRDELRISDFFVLRLLKSNIKVNGCYSNALAVATSCFHTPDN
ncbi:LOW QUALITY PROTEIN: hypothetical protein V1477_001531 [Vespula maculifrons]|uniref:Secreted protein n=1 Tax=Vespula maculifrons TaxID=7453 RepID=A0ABD2CZV1_VESMC